jgi:hypothetical protein
MAPVVLTLPVYQQETLKVQKLMFLLFVHGEFNFYLVLTRRVPFVEQELLTRALKTFKLEGELTSLSDSSQGEVGDNRGVWEKLIAINRNIVSRHL